MKTILSNTNITVTDVCVQDTLPALTACFMCMLFLVGKFTVKRHELKFVSLN